MQTNLTPFDHLVRFVECERVLRHTQEERLRVDANLIDLKKSLADEGQRIEALKAHLAALQKEMQSYELERRSLREREKEVRRRLDTVSGPKEYTAYMHEIDELEHAQGVCEDRFCEILERYEPAKKDYDEQHQKAQQFFAEQQTKIDEKQALSVTLARDGEQLKRESVEYEQSVSVEMRELYHQIQKMVPDPFVPVSGIHCSACSFDIAHKDLASLRRHVLVVCRNCFRMLYMP